MSNLDPSEKTVIKDLYKEFEKQWAEREDAAQRELQEKLNEAHQNSVTPLSEQNIQDITDNYWLQKRPELDQTRQNLGDQMLEHYGGEEATKKLLQEDGLEQIQQAKELQEDQQLDMQADQQRQEELAQTQQREKEEKKPEREQEAEQDQNRQMNAEQTKEQQQDLERERLRQEFNHYRGGQDRGR